MDIETVYIGHTDGFSRVFYSAGVAIDTSSVTQIRLTVGSVTIQSDNGDSDPIRWNKAGYAAGQVSFFLGGDLATVGKFAAMVLMIDPTNPGGVVWDRTFFVRVKAEFEVTPYVT